MNYYILLDAYQIVKLIMTFKLFSSIIDALELEKLEKVNENNFQTRFCH